MLTRLITVDAPLVICSVLPYLPPRAACSFSFCSKLIIRHLRTVLGMGIPDDTFLDGKPWNVKSGKKTLGWPTI